MPHPPLPRRKLGEQSPGIPILEGLLGVPIRIPASGPPDLSYSSDGTLRGALETMTGMHRYAYYSSQDRTFLFRNGAVDFCTTEEAAAVWKARLNGK